MIYVKNSDTGFLKKVRSLPPHISPIGFDTRVGAVEVSSDDFDFIDPHRSSPDESYEALVDYARRNISGESRNAIRMLATIFSAEWQNALKLRKVVDTYFFDEDDSWASRDDVLVEQIVADTFHPSA